MSSSSPHTTTITAALLSTTLISLAPNLLLLLFPNIAYSKSSPILKIGQCLAAGGLLGDVFLHTLPGSISGEGGEEVGMMVLVGFSVFLVMDILVRSFGGDHHHHHHHHTPHSHAKENGETKMTNGSHHTTEHTTTTTTGPRFLSSSVLLNLTADALHNFTDGLAIGASYAASTHLSSDLYTLLKSHGGLASLSILLHEIPHELGDFAVLVSNGFSRNEALMAQFGTACAAFAGTVVGLFLGRSVEEFVGHDVLLPFTSGGFVYLACVTILPEVLEEEEDLYDEKEVKEGKKKKSGGLKNRIMQLLAFGVGIAFMCMVSILEELDNGTVAGMGHSHGHHHHHGHGHSHKYEERRKDDDSHDHEHGHEHGHHHGDDL